MQKAKKSMKKMEMNTVGSNSLYFGRPYMSVSISNIETNLLFFNLMGGLSSTLALSTR